jgi:hypothetical protein
MSWVKKGGKLERKKNQQNKPAKYNKYFSQEKSCTVMFRLIRGSRKKSIRKVRINRIIGRNVEVKEVERS